MLIVVLEATVASNSYPALITALPPDGKGSSVNKKTITEAAVLLLPFIYTSDDVKLTTSPFWVVKLRTFIPSRPLVPKQLERLASYTVPLANVPAGIATLLLTMTSLVTLKSTLSPIFAFAPLISLTDSKETIVPAFIVTCWFCAIQVIFADAAINNDNKKLFIYLMIFVPLSPPWLFIFLKSVGTIGYCFFEVVEGPAYKQ